MIAVDPLASVELFAVLEEATTALRHDVRNHMASVRNRAFFVRRKLGQETAVERDPRVVTFLEKIDAEVQQADETIEQWSLRVRGLRLPMPGSVAVADCLQLAVQAARLPSSVVIELTLPSVAFRVVSDLELLALALRCLIENAGEAGGPGPVRVATTALAGQCHLVVSDSGPGLSESARRLERFWTTKPGHLGLGLRMAQRIVTRFGGSLVLGAPALGAEVSLCLPLAQPAPSEGARP